MRSPILVLHMIAGTLGMLSGFAAVFLRKGSHRHGLVGNVFVIAMLTLSASGVFLAVMKSQPGNILGGTVTFYMVATAWMAARRGDGQTNLFDWGALLVALALTVVELTYGFEAATSATRLKYGYPAGPYFFLGSVALLATVGDVRLLVRGGISGTRRIARHLWRMCFALFIASSSIFLARQHLFPAILRKTGALIFLSFLPLGLLIFWLIRVRLTNGSRNLARFTEHLKHFLECFPRDTCGDEDPSNSAGFVDRNLTMFSSTTVVDQFLAERSELFLIHGFYQSLRAQSEGKRRTKSA